MYPDKLWLAIGSGELLNEKITGEGWPAKNLRKERLRECAQVIRALWRGDTVNHYGLVSVEEAKLYTRPENPPPLFGAALTADTAEWLGEWADGLLTASVKPEQLLPLIKAFKDGG
jgi:coenzyme F420-dependent glucose-6-phosphate dehydrogenase